jgi:hypothetical protein
MNSTFGRSPPRNGIELLKTTNTKSETKLRGMDSNSFIVPRRSAAANLSRDKSEANYWRPGVRELD